MSSLKYGFVNARVGALKSHLLDGLEIKKKTKNTGTEIDQKLEVLLRDMENIDKIMGLSISHKYYLVKKL